MRHTPPRQGPLATLLARPDEVMLEMGAGGELLVARLRAILAAMSLSLPLIGAFAGAHARLVMIGLGAAVAFNLVAQAWLALARSPRRRDWLPYASSTADISMTSIVLLLGATAEPAASLNSVVIWCFYLMFVFLTALRNDGRLALYTGALAIVQYGLLVAILMTWQQEQLSSVIYGRVTLAGQLERLVLLMIATVLACTLVYRMQRLTELSARDGLTGLPNRAWLLQRLPRMFAAAGDEPSRPLTLALVGLDHFRRLIDIHGQRSGERAILQVAAMLGDLLAEDEHLVRLSGQEFVLVLRCPAGDAWERLDRTRLALAGSRLLADDGGLPVALGFSAGLAAWPQDGADASSLLGSADRRLQQAKRAGRDRVVARDA